MPVSGGTEISSEKLGTMLGVRAQVWVWCLPRYLRYLSLRSPRRWVWTEKMKTGPSKLETSREGGVVAGKEGRSQVAGNQEYGDPTKREQTACAVSPVKGAQEMTLDLATGGRADADESGYGGTVGTKPDAGGLRTDWEEWQGRWPAFVDVVQ